MDKEMKHYFDKKLVKMLVCCNIPFRAVDSPVFRSFVSALHPGYVPPSSSHVRESLFWDEAARVVRDSTNELKQDKNLTLANDGWTDVGKSLYAYVIITSDRRVYLHALKDFSADRHTATFITSETIKVIEEIGPEQVAALVTDNAANMKKTSSEYMREIPRHLWTSVYASPHQLGDTRYYEARVGERCVTIM